MIFEEGLKGYDVRSRMEWCYVKFSTSGMDWCYVKFNCLKKIIHELLARDRWKGISINTIIE